MSTIISNNPENMIEADSGDMPNGYKYVVKRGDKAAAFDLRKYMKVTRDEVKESRSWPRGLFGGSKAESTRFIEYSLDCEALERDIEKAWRNVA